MWIIRRTDQGRGYVAPPGSEKSYTNSPAKALVFNSEIEAIAYCCPENEIAIPLENLLTFYG